ncbi:PqqD family protein [Pelagibacterium lacus]|uniref:PqqD family protein n=1 Tax=Pelagibacterium lacus TaxID=2282655 RepID=A0A369W6Q3_9HYPH|nr:PqqD family protein [Pelagibacterium lacus]RDE09535.1 PqqD family protein [Pelagibacterium lacus]
MSETFLKIAVPNCTAEEFDGELVAINLETGIYFSIKDGGAVIWRDLVAGHSVQALATLAGDNAALAEGIAAFARQLLDNGLMRPASGAPTASAPAGTAEIVGGMAIPELESFGDMQSLLLLDPVHEVDADAGWPLKDQG